MREGFQLQVYKMKNSLQLQLQHWRTICVYKNGNGLLLQQWEILLSRGYTNGYWNGISKWHGSKDAD